MARRMGKTKKKQMNCGALLFAFNNEKIDYYRMAVQTAKRINYFLEIPVTVVTDINVDENNYNYKFDKVIKVTSDLSNSREEQTWINKGRYKAYELSPYEETLLLDTDYLINSDKLKSVFNYYEDYCFHNNAKYLMFKESGYEPLGPNSFLTYWATVMIFRKTERAKLLFDFIKMVQDNYTHYLTLHGSYSTQYRNDYALTIANRTLNGHIINTKDFIPWDLLHVSKEVKIYSNNDDEFNTSYTAILKHEADPLNTPKLEYIQIEDMDFHMLDKKNFMDVV